MPLLETSSNGPAARQLDGILTPVMPETEKAPGMPGYTALARESGKSQERVHLRTGPVDSAVNPTGATAGSLGQGRMKSV
jgi:hypothetical protein